MHYRAICFARRHPGSPFHLQNWRELFTSGSPIKTQEEWRARLLILRDIWEVLPSFPRDAQSPLSFPAPKQHDTGIEQSIVSCAFICLLFHSVSLAVKVGGSSAIGFGIEGIKPLQLVRITISTDLFPLFSFSFYPGSSLSSH
ncbi:hypothetical protein CEXT_17421 [Caerostris extrusa]|uniref:Uncharacterized protein n=1 Tax=Caerostris extrusa TaxID=172846 RepID=A0AAV4U2H8_CAEEX|nr:hypothetical protein CEXT_17421 [Caerostris extrusa]